MVQVALLAGSLYTAVGLLKLGWITNFLSHSVICGFMTGASVIIALSQVPYLDPTCTPLQASHAQGVLHVCANCNCGFFNNLPVPLLAFLNLFIHHLGMTATCVLCLTYTVICMHMDSTYFTMTFPQSLSNPLTP